MSESQSRLLPMQIGDSDKTTSLFQRAMASIRPTSSSTDSFTRLNQDGYADSDDAEKYSPTMQHVPSWSRFTHQGKLRSRALLSSSLLRIILISIGLTGLVALAIGVDLTSFFYSSASPASLDAINNRTLGFQKIYTIGLPDRTHKRDAQILAAHYTDLDTERCDGVPWQSVPKTEIPDGWSWKKYEDWKGAIGAWRAHMNVMAKIVEEGVESALLLEDDADWDMNIRQQLQAVARGARALQDNPSPKSSPYGDDWDLLWVGACNMKPPTNDKYYIIENDLTVPPISKRYSNFQGPASLKLNHTRLVFQPQHAFCLTGYAISLEGARRLLASNSVVNMGQEIDQKYGRMCGRVEGEMPFRCLTVWPPIVGMHRFEGPYSRDSDIIDFPENARHPEYSHDVTYSTTMNIERLTWGNTTALAQWPDEVREPEVGKDRVFDMTGSIQYIPNPPKEES